MQFDLSLLSVILCQNVTGIFIACPRQSPLPGPNPAVARFHQDIIPIFYVFVVPSLIITALAVLRDVSRLSLHPPDPRAFIFRSLAHICPLSTLVSV